ncbi:coproporphyrinogen dehydrogenase HemZ [Gehongia tenuis]|uniref:Coproporphyrinogen dehydrogenase HemZ n=1 Tax=Gehongia tenuis TaxID=2763655 RepID=A0A926D408_9FIRM|nr:coproporphyrinogen dehydrogenase HemZ [Gehongia tenuis]MBC8531082.1 coproporphyrinogen dehydrogenase HemZ [Gehongia tenuis]
MGLVLNHPELFNDIGDVVRMFDPCPVTLTQDRTGRVLIHEVKKEEDRWRQRAELWEEGKLTAYEEREDPIPGGRPLIQKRIFRRAAKLCVYDLMRKATGKTLPWGSLTGVRPGKLFRDLAGQEGPEGAERILRETYDVSPAKIGLLRRIYSEQKPFLDSTDVRDVDVYIGVPFCRTRCVYCSFAAYAGVKEDLKTRYVDTLLREMEGVWQPLGDRLRVRSVYVGGGTPTALPVRELRRILQKAHALFDPMPEFTVEAGRPDTLNPEVFAMLKGEGVDRICINPQTMNPKTLQIIGREYGEGEIERAFDEARKAGFSWINMDVIAGLPGETAEDFEKTLARIRQLAPENLTVHTLAIKRASELKERLREYALAPVTEVERMLELSCETADALSMEPYYLYRQKYMTGNLENVGWGKKGSYCVYNIDTMEELTSNLAFGAGAITKRYFKKDNRIERAPNVRNLGDYFSRTDEMIDRKIKLFDPSVDIEGGRTYND